MNDFKLVAVLDGDILERRLRNDGQVALDRNALRVDAQLSQHARDGRAGADTAGIAVDGDAQ